MKSNPFHPRGLRYWLLIAVVVTAAAGRLLADDKVVRDKLDAGLNDEAKTYAVFVRMTDQLFCKGGDYEQFCTDHAKAKRTELRTQVIKTLRGKSDDSWKKIEEKVKGLQTGGDLKAPQRFWVVNGFACDANLKACRELVKDEAVSFVYLQRGPVRQHQAREAQPLNDSQKKTFEAVLKSLKEPEGEFSARGLEIPWNLKQLQADRVWDAEKATGQGVVVALADSGLILAPPLMAALWKNPKEEINGKDDANNGYVDDLFGYDFQANSPYVLDDPGVPHGTACGGIIAGRPANKMATGVAPRARLMMLRGMGYLKSYEYALANGADVISMSYMWVNVELGNYRGVFRTAHEHMTAAGLLGVGGAGNFAKSAPPGKQIALPKDIPCVIAAAGIVEDGSQPGFSSKGPCTWKGVKFYDDYPEGKPLPKPDVTTFNGGFPCWSKPAFAEKFKHKEVWKSEDGTYGLYVGLQGNSFAGPHVAGVAALMLSANPDLPAWDVKRLMEETCKALGDKGHNTSYGAGLVQALEAVRAAKKAKR